VGVHNGVTRNTEHDQTPEPPASMRGMETKAKKRKASKSMSGPSQRSIKGKEETHVLILPSQVLSVSSGCASPLCSADCLAACDINNEATTKQARTQL
jgi:hypothetical protein